MKFSLSHYKRIITALLIIGIIYNITSVLWQQKAKYLSRTYWENYKTLEQAYLDSQYINKHPKEWLRDEVVFSYAGGALIKGTNPVLVIPDAPPLGKYLIGISEIVFDNDSVIVAIFGVVSLILLYLLGKQTLKNKFLALLPVFLYSSEPMFKNQFIYTPLMDLFQLVFILAFFIFLNKGFTGKKWTISFFILANIFLGFFIATKFFASGISMIVASILWTIFHRDLKRFLKLVMTIPVAIFILLFSYARVFAFGYDFHRFLGIQKWVLLYHKSNLILPFSIWPLLLLNKWYVWFGDKPVIADSQWSITWPIITIFSFLTIIMYIFKKISKRKEIEILMIWSVCYLGFFSIGQIFSRYFIILLPAFYIITIYGLNELVKNYLISKKKYKI